MHHIAKRAWLWAGLSGLLQVLIFPTPNLYWLCWLAVAPLLVAVLRARRGDTAVAESLAREALLPARPFHALLLGWFSGVIFYAGSNYWVMYSMHVYGGLETPLALGVLLLFCLWLGLQTGLFALLVAAVANGTTNVHAGVRRALLAAPFLWVAIELWRGYVVGFPWDLLGTAQVENIPLTRLATVTGVYGLSVEIMLVNTAFAAAVLARRRARVLLLGAAVLAAAALQASVFVEPPAVPAEGRARLFQQNIPIDQTWRSDTYRQTLGQLSATSAPLGPQENSPRPDLIVWPESPAPFFANDPLFRVILSQTATNAQAYIIAGAVGSDMPKAPGEEPRQIYNSAVLVAPDGTWTARYDKVHLVPFGEFVPLKSLLTFAQKLTREVGDYVPGNGRKVFDLGRYKVGTFICYESVFPGEVRQFAANGAQLFVNISNDGWFGPTAAPYQHLNQARMRAIENQRWILRATNTGITAVIDPYGRVLEQAPRNVQVTLDVPFGIISAQTFYTHHGDWFAWLCVIISLAFVLSGTRLTQWMRRG